MRISRDTAEFLVKGFANLLDQVVEGPDVNRPAIAGKELTVLNLTTTSFDVSFNKATDVETAQTSLAYELYIANSPISLVGSPIYIKSIGTLVDSGVDVSTLSVTGLTEGESYDFNVIVRDADGNETSYTGNYIQTPDETSPTVSNGTLSTSSVQDFSFNVDFNPASDNASDQDALKYLLYISSSNNLTTDAATVEANGTLQDSDFGVTQLTASGLSAGQPYYVNVVVEDEWGNKAIYTSRQVTTTGTPPDSTDPTVSDGTLTPTPSANSILVSFTKASDDISAQSALVYKLYKSGSSNIDTVSNILANGTKVAEDTDVDSLAVPSLSEGQTVYFNIIVEDEAGNQSAYTENSSTTLDTTSPTVSNKSLLVSGISSNGFTVGFAKATDNIDAQSQLTYSLYTSESANIDTDASTVETNGTLRSSGTDVSQLDADGLSDDTLYYINVVVEDTSGNKAIYTMVSQETSTLLTAAGYDGDFILNTIDI